ncbi:MAG: DUF5663 domain-containing protein [Candidatus Saccharibacteria bacterium]
MIQINDALLTEIGLGSLPQEDKRGLLNHIYETLELRVGMRLADQMTNEQLDEFEKYFEARDDKGAFNWLESNFPNYKDIVQQEFDKLKAEVAQSAPQILSAAQNAPAQPAVPQGQQSQPLPQPQSQPAVPPQDPNTTPGLQPQPLPPPEPQMPAPPPAMEPPQPPIAPAA